MRIYLETSIATCGFTWIPADLPRDIHCYLRIYLDTCGSTWRYPSLFADLPGYLRIYLDTSIATCGSTWIPANLPGSRHPSLPADLPGPAERHWTAEPSSTRLETRCPSSRPTLLLHVRQHSRRVTGNHLSQRLMNRKHRRASHSRFHWRAASMEATTRLRNVGPCEHLSTCLWHPVYCTFASHVVTEFLKKVDALAFEKIIKKNYDFTVSEHDDLSWSFVFLAE